MIGSKHRAQPTLFIPGSLEDYIPDDHILKRVDRVLDLSWLRREVAGCYCEDNGRPGIDPEAAARLMLAGFFHGITADRELLRHAQVNIAIRWFAGYELHEALPHHSSLTRIRQRWGPECFMKIFRRIVQDCNARGLISGETLHIDATLVRADVSWESLTAGYVDAALDANEPPQPPTDDDPPPGASAPRKQKQTRKSKRRKKRSGTDPDATMATSRKDHRLEPAFKQHTTVDDKTGVIVDIIISTGEIHEGALLDETIRRTKKLIGRAPERVTADASYANGRNYRSLENQNIDAIIPPQRMQKPRNSVPSIRFKYDEKNDIVRCPKKKILRPSTRMANGRIYQSRPADCAACPLRGGCIPKSATRRTILIVNGYTSLLRARRRHRQKLDSDKHWSARHRFLVEGIHGEAKQQHGLARAARRGIDNLIIQAALTAAVIDLKRLAASVSSRFYAILGRIFRNHVIPASFVSQIPLRRGNGVQKNRKWAA